jgi:hypothetical protein
MANVQRQPMGSIFVPCRISLATSGAAGQPSDPARGQHPPAPAGDAVAAFVAHRQRHPEDWAVDSAPAEARAIVRLVQRDLMSEAEARDLIAVPPATETLFRAIAAEDSALGRTLLDAVEFRARVLAAFDGLIRGG